MELKYFKTISLVPYAKNSRTHSKNQVKQIADSINEFGFTNPILIDENNVIIAGHGRVLAGSLLSLEEVPCIVLSRLSDKQKLAYRIVDNKLALNAGWDDEMLKLDILEIDDEKLNELMGFTDSEIEKIMKVDNEIEPEVPFTEELLESHNFVVLYFDNDVDWLQAQTMLGLRSVKALDSKKGFEKVGIGRVIKGSKIIGRLAKNENIG